MRVLKKIYIQLPFCERNEKLSKKFIAKLNSFIDNKYSLHILWQIRKIKSIFKLKDKNQHPFHVIYEGDCSCGESYIGETMSNEEVRTAEHNDTTLNSEPARHLKQNKSHKFSWRLIYQARKLFKHKILEGLFIKKKTPIT